MLMLNVNVNVNVNEDKYHMIVDANDNNTSNIRSISTTTESFSSKI